MLKLFIVLIPIVLFFYYSNNHGLFFSYLTAFSYFPLKNKFRMLQDSSKMEVLVVGLGVHGFSYFSMIFSYFIFLPESFLNNTSTNVLITQVLMFSFHKLDKSVNTSIMRVVWNRAIQKMPRGSATY